MSKELLSIKEDEEFIQIIEKVLTNNTCTNEQLKKIEGYFYILIKGLRLKDKHDIKFYYMTKLIIYKVRILSSLFMMDYSQSVDVSYLDEFEKNLDKYYDELKKDKKAFKIIEDLIIEVRYSKNYNMYITFIGIITSFIEMENNRDTFINNEQDIFTYNDYDDSKMLYVTYKKSLTRVKVKLDDAISATYE